MTKSSPSSQLHLLFEQVSYQFIAFSPLSGAFVDIKKNNTYWVYSNLQEVCKLGISIWHMLLSVCYCQYDINQAWQTFVDCLCFWKKEKKRQQKDVTCFLQRMSSKQCCAHMERLNLNLFQPLPSCTASRQSFTTRKIHQIQHTMNLLLCTLLESIRKVMLCSTHKKMSSISFCVLEYTCLFTSKSTSTYL